MVNEDRQNALPCPVAPDPRKDQGQATVRGMSLVRQLSLLALLPTAATALLLVALSSYWQQQDLRRLSLEGTQATAAQIAHVAAAPLARGDRNGLLHLAEAASHQRDVRRVQGNFWPSMAAFSPRRACPRPRTLRTLRKQ